MTDPKQYRLVDRIFEKTQRGEIAWKSSIDDEAFQFSSGDNTVQIKYTKRGQSPYLYILILNSEGVIVDSFSDADLDEGSNNTQYWNKLMATYNSARRKVSGADDIINEILNDLEDEIPF